MTLKKGDHITVCVDRTIVSAILIEMVTASHAVVRVMEGPMAGEEIGVDVPHGHETDPDRHPLVATMTTEPRAGAS